MLSYDAHAPKRAVNITMNSDLVASARREHLNLSALAEAAVIVALEQIARDRVTAEIAQGCEVHERYLNEYGSLADAVRISHDGTA